jgi:hypothetical protein
MTFTELDPFSVSGSALLWTPPYPSRLDELDVPEQVVLDLVLRHASVRSVCTIHLLSEVMRLSLEITEAVFRKLNDQQYLEVRRMSGDDYVFTLSPGGRRLAAERALTQRYCGPAPVSLKSYCEAVRSQIPSLSINRSRLQQVFSDIVLRDKVLDAIGPALISQHSIFLYGPSGTGKTTIAERLIRAHDDLIVIPWAVESEGQIIAVADPAVHTPVNVPGLHVDPRWMVCRRPFVAVGGELVTTMLELQKDEASGAWSAPLQMKANNGILLIDDFGRQLISPRDLLNRWIVPLDRRVDFLAFGTGSKFDIPFELLVVFSTNLEPKQLDDEAFLRRIPNKILIEPVDPATFDAIFHLTAAAMGLEYSAATPALLRQLCLRHSPDLRPCFPRDICNAIRAITIYEERPSCIVDQDLERAVAAYFI